MGLRACCGWLVSMVMGVEAKRGKVTDVEF